MTTTIIIIVEMTLCMLLLNMKDVFVCANIHASCSINKELLQKFFKTMLPFRKNGCIYFIAGFSLAAFVVCSFAENCMAIF